MQFFEYIYTFLVYIADAALSIIFTLGSRQGSKHRVLLVRPDAIGDFVLWLDSAQKLREFYKERELHLICNETSFVFAKETSYFDFIYPVQRKKYILNPLYKIIFLLKFFLIKYDLLLYPIYSRDFFVGDSISHVLNAASKVAFYGDFSNINLYQKKISDKFYDVLFRLDDGLSEIEKNLLFLNRVTGKTFDLALPVLRFNQSLELKDLLDFEDKYFVVFPGASKYYKIWPPERFASLIEMLYRYVGWTCVLAGSKIDILQAKTIMSITNVPCVNLVGRTSLIELAWLLKNSEFLIANDTSAVHIAVAVRTPSVCILGGGHFGRFVPYPDISGEMETQYLPVPAYKKMDCFNCDWKCIYTKKRSEPYPCLTDISVENVWGKVKEALEI